MNITQKVVNKWFVVRGKHFRSKKTATTIDEAWEKTLTKWLLMSERRLLPLDINNTCGLCNFSHERGCRGCPITVISGKYCDEEGSPYNEYKMATEIVAERDAIDNMYQFLLIVYYMWGDKR